MRIPYLKCLRWNVNSECRIIKIPSESQLCFYPQCIESITYKNRWHASWLRKITYKNYSIWLMWKKRQLDWSWINVSSWEANELNHQSFVYLFKYFCLSADDVSITRISVVLIHCAIPKTINDKVILTLGQVSKVTDKIIRWDLSNL